MNKHPYLAPQAELIEMSVRAAVLVTSDFAGTSVEDADYHDDLTWE